MAAMPRLVIALLLLLPGGLVQAHEVRPAYLQLTETQQGQFDVLWKQPVLDNRRLPLESKLPEQCSTASAIRPERTAAALLERWSIRCDLRAGTLSVSGLTRTLTDVLVNVDYLDGDDRRFVLKPDQPGQDLSDVTPGLWSYLIIGVEHLVFGIDHILFVVALVLYIQGLWPLLKTITAFTLAHSITLALSVLGLVSVPQAPVEAIIALSILFLARELLVPASERSAITTHSPWIMAFGFGLLHGFGFAGALADIGLPREQLAGALLLFNLGIELGQLLVVAIVLAAAWLIKQWAKEPSPGFGWPQNAAITFPVALALGSIAAYWTIDRILLIV